MTKLNARQVAQIMVRAELRGGSPGRALAGRLSSPMQLRCRGCGAFKDEANFHRDRNRSSGRSGECVPCTKARRAKLYKLKKLASNP